jgi:tripeptide aminopeptidase
MINPDRLANLFLELAAINGPSGCERAVADYARAKMQSLGLNVEEDDVAQDVGSDSGNIYATLPGTVPGATPIFFNCHMDTVEPTDGIRIVRENDEISTDGSTILGADDRAGMAIVLEAIESIVEDKAPHGDVQVIFTVSEEVGLRGAKAMDHSRITGRYGYVFDTQKPPGALTVSAPSHETVAVQVHGKAAHAGMAAENGVSAIIAASRAIARMKLGRIDPETTASIGIINGGKARNIIPDLVTIKGEARSRDESKLADQVEHMRRTFEEEAAAMGATVEFEHVREYDCYRWTAADPIIRLATAALDNAGMETVFQDGGGGSDANIFNSAGVPTVVIGTGYDDAHTHAEHVAVNDLVQATRFAESLIRTAAGWEA